MASPCHWLHRRAAPRPRPASVLGDRSIRTNGWPVRNPCPRPAAPRVVAAPVAGLLPDRPPSGRVRRERKEVMCSVRTQSLHHLAGDDRL